jgi:hypothetical protein
MLTVRTGDGSFKGWEESQFGEDLSPNFFQELLVDDEEARSFHIAQMIESLESSESLLSAHLGTVIRFAFESPFEDIRTKFHQLLERLKVFNPCTFAQHSAHICAHVRLSKFQRPHVLTKRVRIFDFFAERVFLFCAATRKRNPHRVASLRPVHLSRFDPRCYFVRGICVRNVSIDLPPNWPTVSLGSNHRIPSDLPRNRVPNVFDTHSRQGSSHAAMENLHWNHLCSALRLRLSGPLVGAGLLISRRKFRVA